MKFITAFILVMSSLLPTTAIAAPSSPATDSKVMEVITVTYRSPIDYALYQYTTELLAYFRLQIQADIYTQARSGSLQMGQSIHRQLEADKSAWINPNTHTSWQDKTYSPQFF
ncbi:hypothetical protein [Shewanella violacea]|uniref:Uncharacterized protein n=1 Tax=Shewanella violacea (strain JCM 10179 / CIP 106290 / LMG 19151 / DSS12) TaxID=637905 RepID=D4ZBG8_SHEVD|nr:hypothetical protein [Shewanella violacea]BAJ03363.1 conserved hypothetical protein [Shewanella violacea DSS12]